MCLIVVAWQYHPQYPLIVVANRDEYYQRPTRPAHRWSGHEQLLAGQDIVSGGTWLGINTKYKFAAVTNFRERLVGNQFRSRGELTTNFLSHDSDPLQYAERCVQEGPQFNGYNLLIGNHDELLYCSNRTPRIKILGSGLYTLSNHLLNTPWPKTNQVKECLIPLLAAEKLNIKEIINCMLQQQSFPDEQLPNTGVGLEWERILAPPFIVSPDYGTRSTTVLIRDHFGRSHFVEQTFLPGGLAATRRDFYLGYK